jgi:tryptophan-rich sensory protein
MTDRTYRRIFLVGALWNLLGAGLFFLFWRQAFALFQLAHPNYLAFFQAWLALAFVFGIGYYYVYRDLYENLNIVRLGIYGKTVFAVIFMYHVVFSGFHPVFLSGAIIDLIFVVLYARFLAYARTRKA